MAPALWVTDAEAVNAATAEQQINVRQNDFEQIQLLCAADTAHRRARRAESARTCITIAFAALAVVAATYDRLAGLLAIAGVVATLVSELVESLLGHRWTARAMLLQERFDTRLFGIPWNDQLGPEPLIEDVHHLAKKFKGSVDKKRDWYVDVSGLPLAYAVPICQRENLVWDFRLRRSWGWVVGTGAIGWIVVGVLIALAADWSTRDLLIRWIAPSLPALVFGFQKAHAHLTTASAKESVARSLQATLDGLRPGDPSPGDEQRLSALARENQDEIARLRERDDRVPSKLYWQRRDTDESGARQAGAALRTRLLDGS